MRRMPEAIDAAALYQLQFTDPTEAEAKTRNWLSETFTLPVSNVRLNPSAASINSFNGIAVINGDRLFFKTHADAKTIQREYENAHLLHEAGYETLLPLRIVESGGRKLLLYPAVNWPTAFSLVCEHEQGGDPTLAERILSAEASENPRLLDIYERTAVPASANRHATSAIHQLFCDRLADAGRLGTFYKDAVLGLPDGGSVPTADLFDRRWTINDVEQPRTINELVREARQVLDPSQQAFVAVGHGDAHFDNVFLSDADRYVYFDAAFSGYHSPLLDVAKPLYEGVFSRWMYYAAEMAESVPIDVSLSANRVEVTYRPNLSRFRQQVLDAKQRLLIEPLLHWMKSKDALPHGRRPLDLALMCCPLLTMNLCDANRFPVAISWLAFAHAVQMGNWDTDQELRSTPNETVA